MIGRLLGKKLGMTRIFDAEGTALPVTVVEAGPCYVVQKKPRPPTGMTQCSLDLSGKGWKN